MTREQERLAILTAMAEAVADLPRLGAVLAGSDDEPAALQRLQQEYGFTTDQAQAVLDCRFATMTRHRRTRIAAEIEALRDAVAGRWDPPLELAATVHSARRITLLVDGVGHEVRGTSRNDALSRLGQLVHEEVAEPARRRVLVTATGATDGPVRVLVDPTGGAGFEYGDRTDEGNRPG
ncbi:hypothetical protein GCU60_08230 [Blastococcus saxobsidens]|uniref:Uncharacterized protein n=1 Tax=Blastococcus saxobsidens TaxID=138336 RepID=A0A6L9W181_9ACTN|nr:hypothetical protein [Blastococcus saxobsidens]NEK85748.1 hypothetical protein [Blastococcus saxobsidens]